MKPKITDFPSWVNSDLEIIRQECRPRTASVFAAHILIGQCQPSTPSSTSPPRRRPVPNNVSRSFVPLLVGEPSTRRPGLCCTQLQPSTSSSTLPHRRPVPDTVSLSFVPVLVGPWSACGFGWCCTVDSSLRHRYLDDLFSTCSWQRFAVLRAASCWGTVN